MRFISIGVAVLLAACAATPEVDMPTVRSAWQGTTYDEVVARWGVPARSTRLADGRDAYTWVSETVVSRGALWPSIGIFGGSGGIGVGTGVTVGPGGGELQRCERTLFFQNGRVVEQTWQGPAEYCSSFRK
ncbi:MAG: hypothetical protein ACXWUH_09890 [Burkholderiales bacterium]